MNDFIKKFTDNLNNFLPECLYSNWTDGTFALYLDEEKKHLWVNINDFFKDNYTHSFETEDGIKIGLFLDFGCDCIRFFNEHKDLCSEEIISYLNRFPTDLKSDWIYTNHYELTTCNSKHYFWVILPELFTYFDKTRGSVSFTDAGVDFGNFIDFSCICLKYIREKNLLSA